VVDTTNNLTIIFHYMFSLAAKENVRFNINKAGN